MSRNEQRDSNLPEFGQVNPQQALHGLDRQSDRDRGFLTENDRQYLVRRNLSGQGERRARMRIRERILAGYFDARYFQFVSDEDRQQIFQKACDDYDLHFANAVKEFARFTHLGLTEFNVDTTALLEAGLEEAEKEYARADGRVVDVDVTVQIDRKEGPDATELEEKFQNREELHRDELAALVNSPYTSVDLVDALYYQSRQQFGGADLHTAPRDPTYSWEDPDEERTEKIVEELRDVVDDLGIETLDEYATVYERLAANDEGDGYDHQLHELVRELDRVAPHFIEDLAEQAGLAVSDMELLHDIIWNPENKDVEDAVKPPTAGPDWDPEGDRVLQKFIARVKVARERGAVISNWSDEHRRRWQRLRDLAGFDEEEWGKYMEEQRVNRVKDAIESLFEERKHLTRSEIDGVSSHEEFLEQFAGEGDAEVSYLVTRYGDHVLEKALEELATEWSEEDR